MLCYGATCFSSGRCERGKGGVSPCPVETKRPLKLFQIKGGRDLQLLEDVAAFSVRLPLVGRRSEAPPGAQFVLWCCLTVCSAAVAAAAAAAALIINRNIKASGAILVCDNPPHPRVSTTTLTCRCHGNTGYVIMPPHPADIEPRRVSTAAHSGTVTCWLLYQPVDSYIREGVPSREEQL